MLDPPADGPFPGCDRDIIEITDAAKHQPHGSMYL